MAILQKQNKERGKPAHVKFLSDFLIWSYEKVLRFKNDKRSRYDFNQHLSDMVFCTNDVFGHLPGINKEKTGERQMEKQDYNLGISLSSAVLAPSYNT